MANVLVNNANSTHVHPLRQCGDLRMKPEAISALNKARALDIVDYTYYNRPNFEQYVLTGLRRRLRNFRPWIAFCFLPFYTNTNER